MSRRWPALLLIPALLVGAGVIDRRDGPPVDETVAPIDDGGDEEGAGDELARIEVGPVDPNVVMPVVADADALGSTWYCAGGTGYASGAEARDPISDDGTVGRPSTAAEGDGEAPAEELEQVVNEPRPPVVADHRVVVANITEEPIEAEVTVFAADTEPVTAAIEIEAFGRTALRLGELLEAPFVAALVEADGPGIAVEHEVSGPEGIDAAPCSSSASDRWFFAAGSTTTDVRELLVLFNPFPDAANVDISFVADDGRRTPQQFQGLIVPGRSVVAADVGAAVTVRPHLAATVTTRTGRVIVDRIQTFDGSGPGTEDEGPEGLTIGLGAAQPATAWSFPDGKKVEGNDERFVFYNPTERDAEVDLEVVAVQQDAADIVPFELTVRAGAFTVLDVGDEDRIPADVAFTAVARSINGVPFVAERQDFRDEPSSRLGVGTTLGSPLESTRWVFPVGSATDEVDEFLTLRNPTDEPLTVRVRALVGGGLDAVDDVEVAPRSARSIDVGEALGEEVTELSLLVGADRPFVAERGLYRAEERGLSTRVGIPTLEGSRVP